MTKRIKRQFWLSPEGNAELKRKAQLSGINETSVIRILIRGYEPKKTGRKILCSDAAALCH